MFRIRRIGDDHSPGNPEAIARVLAILREQFPRLKESDVVKLPDEMRHPEAYQFQFYLIVAEGGPSDMRGFAFFSYAPDLNFCFLDYIAAAKGRVQGGIGSALYQRVREEARALGALGIFFECLPDDPMLAPNPVIRRENQARLRFYERFGARPIAGTKYETPVLTGELYPPYLVFDDLGGGKPFRRALARTIVRAILERKYGPRCPPAYVSMVVASFKDDPVRLRAPLLPPGKVVRSLPPRCSAGAPHRARRQRAPCYPPHPRARLCGSAGAGGEHPAGDPAHGPL